MYTGIVQGAYPVVALEQLEGLHRLSIALPVAVRQGLTVGASVAVDGVCLTVTGLTDTAVDFDVMAETLRLSTLGQLRVGAPVNIERSARQGDEVGGHPLSGHVDATAEVVDVERAPNNHRVYYRVPEALLPYIFRKGFIALNGCSLTVADVDRARARFSVCYIPETLRVTTHGEKTVGDRVNVEVDRQTQAIVDTVQNLLADNPEWLRQLLAGGGA